jgi:hypothetical protein
MKDEEILAKINGKIQEVNLLVSSAGNKDGVSVVFDNLTKAFKVWLVALVAFTGVTVFGWAAMSFTELEFVTLDWRLIRFIFTMTVIFPVIYLIVETLEGW